MYILAYWRGDIFLILRDFWGIKGVGGFLGGRVSGQNIHPWRRRRNRIKLELPVTDISIPVPRPCHKTILPHYHS